MLQVSVENRKFITGCCFLWLFISGPASGLVSLSLGRHPPGLKEDKPDLEFELYVSLANAIAFSLILVTNAPIEPAPRGATEKDMDPLTARSIGYCCCAFALIPAGITAAILCVRFPGQVVMGPFEDAWPVATYDFWTPYWTCVGFELVFSIMLAIPIGIAAVLVKQTILLALDNYAREGYRVTCTCICRFLGELIVGAIIAAVIGALVVLYLWYYSQYEIVYY